MTSIGHIYQIICKTRPSICYIGSTFNRLHKRFEGHKSDYKHNHGTNSIHEYFDKYGIDNFKIILIKSYEVIRTNNKDFRHLHAYETLWMNRIKCINKCLAFNPLKKEYKKEWYESNKERIKEKYEKNIDKIKQTKREHYERNNEKLKNISLNYYNENKFIINKKRNKENKEKVKCNICNKEINKSSLSRHIKQIHN
jgi:hypothetical protein